MTRALAALVLVVLSGASAAAAQELPRGLFPVIREEGVRARVVLRAQTDPAWARGELRLLRRAYPTVVSRGARLGALPPDVRADARGVLELSDGHRTVCTARIGRPHLLRALDPDFDYATWSGEEGGHRYTDDEVARAAWDRVPEHERLVAAVIPIAGDCTRARWASRRAPRFGTAAALPDPALVAAYRALPEHQALAEAWIEASEYDDDPHAASWDERAGAGRLQVDLRVGQRDFSLVVAEAHDGCGDFTGSLWALFERGPDGPRLIRASHSYLPTMSGLADFDGDGVPEVLGQRVVVSSAGGDPVDVNAVFLGCPC
ncbi:MAG: hypothetical protein H6719_07955 [Sandaracinaceae bacterium]|nr:hypothetical protein [Sandaracinaceae bacterium]